MKLAGSENDSGFEHDEAVRDAAVADVTCEDEWVGIESGMMSKCATHPLNPQSTRAS